MQTYVIMIVWCIIHAFEVECGLATKHAFFNQVLLVLDLVVLFP